MQSCPYNVDRPPHVDSTYAASVTISLRAPHYIPNTAHKIHQAQSRITKTKSKCTSSLKQAGHLNESQGLEKPYDSHENP